MLSDFCSTIQYIFQMYQIWLNSSFSNFPVQFCTIYPLYQQITPPISQLEINPLNFQNSSVQRKQLDQSSRILYSNNNGTTFGKAIIMPSADQLGNRNKRFLRKYWTSSQDQKLINLYKIYPNQWKKIANRLKPRNQSMCYSRYQRLLRGRTKYWTKEIDNEISQKVELLGFQWKQISKSIPGKTPKQIRERYLNFLRPNIIKTEWTPEQDRKICQLVQTTGRRWKNFQNYLVGRTQNQIKGRFYGHLKKLLQKKINIQADAL